jgi:hypothetical protein
MKHIQLRLVRYETYLLYAPVFVNKHYVACFSALLYNAENTTTSASKVSLRENCTYACFFVLRKNNGAGRGT